jgi:hypothetical protein
MGGNTCGIANEVTYVNGAAYVNDPVPPKPTPTPTPPIPVPPVPKPSPTCPCPIPRCLRVHLVLSKLGNQTMSNGTSFQKISKGKRRSSK